MSTLGFADALSHAGVRFLAALAEICIYSCPTDRTSTGIETGSPTLFAMMPDCEENTQGADLGLKDPLDTAARSVSSPWQGHEHL